VEKPPRERSARVEQKDFVSRAEVRAQGPSDHRSPISDQNGDTCFWAIGLGSEPEPAPAFARVLVALGRIRGAGGREWPEYRAAALLLCGARKFNAAVTVSEQLASIFETCCANGTP